MFSCSVLFHPLTVSLGGVRVLSEFREPRVIELWEMARRSNLSEDELDSLKVRLQPH